MWQRKSLSLILPTVNEIDSIAHVVRTFQNLKLIDEILVVDNNADYDVTSVLSKTKAKVIKEKVKGYGAAIRRGLKTAKSDYHIVCEPDGTFIPSDVFKLLSYSSDFDFVVGTRTTDSLIWTGANMGFFLKWGNFLVAKCMEILFNTSSLSDVGCTLRLIKRKALNQIQPKFTSNGADFGLEMMLLVVKKHISFIQIPVNYRDRIGKSTITGSKIKAILLGLQMLLLIGKYRLGLM